MGQLKGFEHVCKVIGADCIFEEDLNVHAHIFIVSAGKVQHPNPQLDEMVHINNAWIQNYN